MEQFIVVWQNKHNRIILDKDDNMYTPQHLRNDKWYDYIEYDDTYQELDLHPCFEKASQALSYIRGRE